MVEACPGGSELDFAGAQIRALDWSVGNLFRNLID